MKSSQIHLQAHAGGHGPPEGPLADVANAVDGHEVGAKLADPVAHEGSITFGQLGLRWTVFRTDHATFKGSGLKKSIIFELKMIRVDF